MTHRTLIIILLLNTTLLAQNNSSVDVFYGYKTFLSSFNDQLNTVNKFNFNSPVSTIGLALPNGMYLNTQFLSKVYLELDMKLSYNQIIPKTIHIQDSLPCSLNGFFASAAFGVDIFRKSKRFDLMVFLGFDVGGIKIYNKDFINQTNPFFSPKMGLQPKIKLSKLLVTLSLEYGQDVSNYSWKKKNSQNDNISLKNFNQSGFVTSLGLGYTFN